MKRTLVLLCCLSLSGMSRAQNTSYNERARAYVQQYASWAIEEQHRSGIPAAITLAQGIYETGAGSSELATQANNHFGIKCKKEWKGQTFAHTDDAPNECFRKYESAKHSYRDHSDYLKSAPRYASLFELEKTNYVAWATGLKRCGYATNPQYAQKLIKTVEDFSLQEYTLAALNQRPDEVVPVQEMNVIPAVAKVEMTATPAFASAKTVPAPAEPSEGIQLVNGIKAIYCHKGETLLDKAIKYNVRYARLLEINELADEPLKRDMFIYLERKNAKGAHATYIVKEGETVEQIAHEEGMHARQLRVFNLLAQNEQPVAGSVLKLQEQSDTRPATYLSAQATAKAKPQSPIRLADPGAIAPKATYVATQAPATAETEVEIGYGAERPSHIPVPESANEVKQEIPVATPAPVKEAPQQKESAEDEPQDELSRLKARLDKAVYSGSAPGSNMKVSSTDPGPVMSAHAPEPKAATPSASAQTAGAAAGYHTVQKGETAFSIARKYNITMKQLRDWNSLNFEGIKLGQKLRIK